MFTSDQLTASLEGDVTVLTREDGTCLRTLTIGAGPTVVLAHGFGFSADEWNLVADRLVSRGHRVVAFDQRGHGGSTIGSDGIGSAQMAGDYAAVLEAYDVRDAVLVGHSMGGFVGIRFLLDYPGMAAERLRGAVLVATFAGDVNRRNLQNRFQIPMLRSGILQRMLGNRAMARAFTKTLVGDGIPVEAVVDAFIPVFLDQDHRALVPILQAFVDENHYGRLGEIDLPTTILIGDRDKTTPAFHTDALGEGIRGSKVVRLAGKGHFLNWEALDEVVAEVVTLSAPVG